MSLLELSHLSKRRRGGMRDRIVLRDVSLEVDRGEFVVIWGQRGSGRPTLLGVAAGIEGPDTGTVCFRGQRPRRFARGCARGGDRLLPPETARAGR
jgi:ABC-type lipoprotein export system ATPase subunit